MTDARYAIAVGRFYEELAEQHLTGAQKAFSEAGASVEVHDVPGAYELPLTRSTSPRAAGIGGVACLGAVIRGETDHYDYVCNEAARGIQDVQLRAGVPCAFGVLTVERMEQALARSGGDHRDTGYHEGEVVLRMAALRAELGEVRRHRPHLHAHARHRPADRSGDLGRARGRARVVNVGAGTGSYEPPDREVDGGRAVGGDDRPAPAGPAPAVQASAEELPSRTRASTPRWRCSPCITGPTGAAASTSCAGWRSA